MNNIFINQNTPPPLSNTHNGYEYVDLGLSVLWATCNVGATTPEGYGSYFAWGGTVGGTYFSQERAPYWISGTSYSSEWSKYVTARGYGTVDDKSILEPEDDAAHVIMGGDWRMPSIEEFRELYDACDTVYIKQNEVNGRLFTLKTDASKSLFFPAAGSRTSSGANIGDAGYYWSSSLYEKDCYKSYYLQFTRSSINFTEAQRYIGQTIHAVLPKT